MNKSVPFYPILTHDHIHTEWDKIKITTLIKNNDPISGLLCNVRAIEKNYIYRLNTLKMIYSACNLFSFYANIHLTFRWTLILTTYHIDLGAVFSMMKSCTNSDARKSSFVSIWTNTTIRPRISSDKSQQRHHCITNQDFLCGFFIL